MRDYYEDLWERLPADLRPPDRVRRERFLLDHVAPGDLVADVGCGEGDFTALLAARGMRAVGLDVAEAALKRARGRHPGLDFRRVEVDGPLPFEDGAVDAVWASEVVEHVADTARWLSEARRVLRRGGRLLLTTPYHGRVRRTALALARFDEHFDPQGEHLRFYSRRSLCALLHDFGFVDVTTATTGGPPLLRRTLLAAGRRA